MDQVFNILFQDISVIILAFVYKRKFASYGNGYSNKNIPFGNLKTKGFG